MITHPLLSQRAGYGIKLGLSRVGEVLQFLGEPQDAMASVHIAGTNGKGSTCALISSALQEAGYRVGLYTSPHLIHVNERFKINGVAVSDADLSEEIESLDRSLREWAQARGEHLQPLTYYEFVTVMAFVYFAKMGVDIMVVEVGLGGRLDATNVVHPLVTAIVSVGLDHTDKLGDTLAAIATEKAGIIKRGVPVVTGALGEEARNAVSRVAEYYGAEVWRPGAHLFRESCRDGWALRTPIGGLSGVKLQLAGAHQGHNAMVALGVLHQLNALGFSVSDEAIFAGFENASLAGRCQRPHPRVLVDGAHNPHAARALAALLEASPRPKSRILLLGMGDDRDPVSFVEPLLPYIDEIVTTRCAHPKARDSRQLALALGKVDCLLADGGMIEKALPDVFADADEVLVSGSLYVVGAALSLIGDGVLSEVDRRARPESD
jgi:dihydrofolate synthase/folylpolyglutamate synthase